MRALLIALALVLAGCSSGGASRPDVTGGFSLELASTGEGGSNALYRVERDGSLSFGGGFEAVQGKTTWTGQMTAEEIQQLKQLVESNGWLGRDVADAPPPPERTYRIDVRTAQGHRSHKVKGPSPQVVPVHEFLDRVARRRHEGFLQTLPKPDLKQ